MTKNKKNLKKKPEQTEIKSEKTELKRPTDDQLIAVYEQMKEYYASRSTLGPSPEILNQLTDMGFHLKTITSKIDVVYSKLTDVESNVDSLYKSFIWLTGQIVPKPTPNTPFLEKLPHPALQPKFDPITKVTDEMINLGLSRDLIKTDREKTIRLTAQIDKPLFNKIHAHLKFHGFKYISDGRNTRWERQ